MEFKEYIDDHLQGNPKYSFWQKLLRVIEDAYNHLNLISEQMPTYDIHDSRHSEKVQENIFKLINPKIESLSLYELILMYAAGSFHDVGMALPAWEFDLLKATEGTDEIHDNSLQILIGNDFKSPMSLSAIKEFVDSHKDVIYGSFDEAREFVFAPSSEDSLQTALVNSIAEYQLFRNRRAAELQEALPDSAAFLAVSKQIRSDYIRDTHHVRVERYVYALQEAFSDCLGDLDAHRFVSDLAAVCRSHGEEYKFVTNLDSASSVSDLGGANLRFVATVLRIGDIVHYDAKRAPASLRAEKLIYKSPSMPHWTTKDEDVSYDIVSSSEGGVIRFKAFCTNPDSFYNLHDYIDQINHELAHYYSFLNGAVPDERSKYDLSLCPRVDSSQVVADESRFIPDINAGFTMDQTRVIELLTGTQLYADKYLCLRELYQNALDACKCMKAELGIRSVAENLRIEFGIEENGAGEIYLYCLDNGVGMSRHIVTEYFLNVGNSYYKSGEFIGSNIAWKNAVHPTSQFGIGALSFFMLGSRIEIVTKHFEGGDEGILSFTVDGQNKRFFYTPPDPPDAEKIGPHGTLVRIILDDEITKELNNDYFENVERLIYADSYRVENIMLPEYERFKQSLTCKLNSQVSFPCDDIAVNVKTRDGVQPIVPHDAVFQLKKEWATPSFLEDVCHMHFIEKRSGVNTMQLAMSNKDNVDQRVVKYEINGVEITTLLSVPKKLLMSLIWLYLP